MTGITGWNTRIKRLSKNDYPVIAAACRTPIGSFNGSLSSLSAPELGSVVVRETVRRAGIKPESVEEVIMGCVLPAGVGQAPARQAALYADLPNSVQCTTVNKVCGSGMKAVMLAAQAIRAGDANVIVAGGMESMSNAPYLLKKAREGYRLGHGELIDSMVTDGLWDVYNDFHMGSAAELCSRECNVPREAQDEFAVSSYEKALKAQKEGLFDEEIVGVEIQQKKGESVLFDSDEEPGRVIFEKIPKLKSAFEEGGTVTAANASKINDGASAMMVLSAEKAEELGVEPMAKIVAYSTAAKAPEWFTTAPVQAIETVLEKAGLTLDDIELFELNEAFAVVGLAVSDELGIDMSKLNVNGGAVALGHPLGASGARITTTLLYAMKQRDAKLGLAAICLGGGEATAMIVER
ncbi:MAG: thiolase family protein [Candidatus Marinimicrobia bacterium]|nr:thiolase family protein [Candidatus Neomarinimicrobiota bacterium]